MSETHHMIFTQHACSWQDYPAATLALTCHEQSYTSNQSRVIPRSPGMHVPHSDNMATTPFLNSSIEQCALHTRDVMLVRDKSTAALCWTHFNRVWCRWSANPQCSVHDQFHNLPKHISKQMVTNHRIKLCEIQARWIVFRGRGGESVPEPQTGREKELPTWLSCGRSPMKAAVLIV